jgi:diguanylate cyclase
MTATWARYLLVGVLAAAADIVLPVGLVRDVLFCTVAASGALAMAAGVRRNRSSGSDA